MRTAEGGWENGLNPSTINNFRQNTPELVIRDARRMLSLNEEQCQILRDILLARGINKWLKARRDIIRYKEKVKESIKYIQSTYKKGDVAQKATLQVLNLVRRDLRIICHQSRWVIWPEIATASKAEKRIEIK